MIKIMTVIDRETNEEVDPSMIFINEESDGGSTSLYTLISNLLDRYIIVIN